MGSSLPEMREVSFNYGYADEASGKLGERDYFWLQVVNDGVDVVPRQKLFFEENCYHRKAVAEIGPVPAHTSADPVTVPVDVKKKGSDCTIRHLCKEFVINFEKMRNFYEGKICVRNYNYGLMEYKPKSSQISRYNVLLFGEAGSTKSSFLNTVATMLQNKHGRISDSARLQKNAPVGGGGTYVTASLQCYSMEELHGFPINIWDTWGLTRDSYKNTELLELLVSGKLPRNWNFKKHSIEKFSHKFESVKETECLTTEMHAVVFVMPHSYLEDESAAEVDLVAKTFQRLIELLYNPVILLSKVDELDQEIRDHPLENSELLLDLRKKFSRRFKVPMNNINFTVNYYHETDRVFEIDALAYENMLLILQFCRSFEDSRWLQYGGLSAKEATDDENLIWPDSE